MTAPVIRIEADKLRERLRGGGLYGQALDMQSADMLIVASYLLGVRDELERCKETTRLLDELRGNRKESKVVENG